MKPPYCQPCHVRTAGVPGSVGRTAIAVRRFLGRRSSDRRWFWSDDHRGRRGMPGVRTPGLASGDGAGSVAACRPTRGADERAHV